MKIDDINGKYPDFGVYCEPESHAVFATEPCMLAAYRRLGSLRAYLVVDPETQTVVAHMRNEAGRWTTTSSGEGDLLMLPCPEMMLSVSDLFE